RGNDAGEADGANVCGDTPTIYGTTPRGSNGVAGGFERSASREDVETHARGPSQILDCGRIGEKCCHLTIWSRATIPRPDWQLTHALPCCMAHPIGQADAP